MTKKELLEKTPEELVDLIHEQAGQIKAKQNEIDLTAKVNENLNTEVERLSKIAPAAATEVSSNGISKETFAYDKRKFGFKKRGVFHKGNTISADEVLASKALQKELVDMNSGLIYEIAQNN